MPSTRAARRAAAARLLLELPTDVLGLVLYQLPLAHDIASVAPTCHALDDAAKLAQKARPFSGAIVTLGGRNPVNAVLAAPDGRIMTASTGIVKVWRDGSCERTIQQHADTILGMAVLGGARFVTGSYDCTAKLFAHDGTLERTVKMGSHVWCVAALPDGVHFLVGFWEGDVKLYHVDGTLVYAVEEHERAVYALAVTPDGQHIISGGRDKLVKVRSVASKSLVSTCVGHTASVNVLSAMPDGQRFLSGSNDNTVRVWLLDGTLKKTLTLHTDRVTALVALPDNRHALSGSSDGTVRLFNVNDGALLRTFTQHTSVVSSLALLPDGLRFVSGAYDAKARIAYHGLAPHT